ncbi:DUF881 domain-containing protein [Nocardioides massiliensis]|uniref:Uncharacterized protein YlxW (UPF0749 family) n=1 Tax=Nocardioides massiliensis TaxID=1325935 RepID=A0ABT9NR92_9ACTN|nr:DUF881 domain-containing protein [Nocardioides massiliensis]MDP9822951.1 uncharacterized protein YlxW (UPF0749 family) [Nocardioides massiliensis]
MGLLDLVTSQSLDQDYVAVAERRRQAADSEEAPAEPSAAERRGIGTVGLVVVAVFGALMVTAGLETSRLADDRASGRDELINQIAERREVVEARRERVETLRQENEELETSLIEETAAGRALSTRVARLSLATGLVPVRGPGVKVVVDDAEGAGSDLERVMDVDLQKLANALWAAGAEAMAINGKRVTATTAIRQAGAAITVNYQAIRRPYVVEAIGDPDTIPARFVDNRHGADWFDLQRAVGLRFTMNREENLTLPGAEDFRLRYATSEPVGAR